MLERTGLKALERTVIYPADGEKKMKQIGRITLQKPNQEQYMI